MKPSYLFPLIGIPVASAAIASDFCGSSEPPPEALDVARGFQTARRARAEDGSSSAGVNRTETLVISTYVHVVETEEDAGFVTDQMLEDQVCAQCLHDG